MGSEKRVKMSNAQRAKQFLPFSAVRGLEEALERKRQEILVEDKVILDEGGLEELDAALKSLFSGDLVEIEYYDGKMERTEEGRVKAVLTQDGSLVLEDNIIAFCDIRRLRKKTIKNAGT